MTTNADSEPPYWERKTLAEMSPTEWENLCDGCGRCCLHKLEDEHSRKIFYTQIACRLLKTDTCRCRHYEERQTHVEDCVVLTPDNLEQLDWMPNSCAYRRVADGRGLAEWHPLVSGDPTSVHAAGISVRSFAIPEVEVDEDDTEEFIIKLCDG